MSSNSELPDARRQDVLREADVEDVAGDGAAGPGEERVDGLGVGQPDLDGRDDRAPSSGRGSLRSDSSAISTPPAPATASRTRSRAVRSAAPKGSPAPTAKGVAGLDAARRRSPARPRPPLRSPPPASGTRARRRGPSTSARRAPSAGARPARRVSAGPSGSRPACARGRAASWCCRRLSPTFPLISSAFASSVSRSP